MAAIAATPATTADVDTIRCAQRAAAAQAKRRPWASDRAILRWQRAAALQAAYDGLEARIAELAAQEELAAIRPDLDGNQIMQILGIGPGREIGAAYNHLLELRLERGPLGEEEAERELRAWWASRS